MRKIFSSILLLPIVFGSACQTNNNKKENSQTPSPGSTVTTHTVQLSEANSSLAGFISTYHLWVPGTSYTIPDYSNQELILKTSSGTGILPGGVSINADETYIWNSNWDGKTIKGKWKNTGDKDYPILLLQAQEGKDWKVGKAPGKGVDIILWDGSTWYNGKKVK